uniref:F-box domain-containing protein n=1 Tax=Mycena chlorophos TaxID=658473 RepID=A0ABQ0L4J4_MYCCL|nr:predicted protein [Mycena chlorophos]
MGDLPPEIWTQILCLACTDDGASGRALSLVSKDWRNISAPFKLQSVALVGARPILRFLALLDSMPESLRTVNSLFIGCDRPRPQPGAEPKLAPLDLIEERTRGLEFTDRLFPELGIKYTTSTNRKQLVNITVEALEEAIQRILRRIAGSINTLYLHVFFQRPTALLYGTVKLPRLRVLVLHGTFGVSSPNGESLPNLRHLRIAGAPTPGQTIKASVLLGGIASSAPRLTRFYVAQAALNFSTARRDLERAMERTSLRGLERLYVEIGPSRGRTPPPGAANSSERTERGALLSFAEDDGRVRIVKEPRW